MIPAGSMDTINFIHRIRQIGQILSRNYHKIIVHFLPSGQNLLCHSLSSLLGRSILKILSIISVKSGIVSEAIGQRHFRGLFPRPDFPLSSEELFGYDILLRTDFHMLQEQLVQIAFGDVKVVADRIDGDGFRNVLLDINHGAVDQRIHCAGAVQICFRRGQRYIIQCLLHQVQKNILQDDSSQMCAIIIEFPEKVGDQSISVEMNDGEVLGNPFKYIRAQLSFVEENIISFVFRDTVGLDGMALSGPGKDQAVSGKRVHSSVQTVGHVSFFEENHFADVVLMQRKGHDSLKAGMVEIAVGGSVAGISGIGHGHPFCG